MNDRHIFGWGLPPGVSANMIPGNRPEDEAWENIYDTFWDKERLTTTHIGIRISDKEYEQMDKLYNSKLSELIDSYIMAAIEYGMEVGSRQAEDCHQENRFYETNFIMETLEKAGVSAEVIKKIQNILDGNYETP